MMPNAQTNSLDEEKPAIDEATITPVTDEQDSVKTVVKGWREPLLKDYHPLRTGLPGRYA